MLRVLSVVCVSLSLSACSVGYMSLPFAQPRSVSPSIAQADPEPLPPPRAAMLTTPAKRGLGGPPLAVTPMATSSTTPNAADTAQPVSPLADDPRADAIAVINELRHAKGLPALTISAELTRAAHLQATTIARLGKLAHVGPNGSTPLDRVRRTGYRPRMAAENIAAGQATVGDAIASWRGSDMHLRNLLLPDATQLGIARVDDPTTNLRTIWTLVLAAPL